MINLKNFNLSYKNKNLLEHTDFEAKENELVFIKGKSGCGKTTLLYALSLITGIEGDYYWNHQKINDFNNSQKANIRKKYLGIVMQDCMLYSYMTVKENISYYASLNSIELDEEEMMEYLKKLHMETSLHKKVRNLSGGEKQRIAIICAVVKKPQVLILDEPTSQLDKNTEQLVMDWLKELIEKERICIIMTTHKALDCYADKIYLFENNHLKLIFHHDINEKSQLFDNQKDHHISYKINKYKQFQWIKRFILFFIIPFLALELNNITSFYNQYQIQVLEENSIKMIYSQDYHKEVVYIDNEEVQLLFYVKQNHLQSRATLVYKDNGCYINQQLYQELHRDLKGKSLFINYHQKEFEFQVSGILTGESFINQKMNEYCIYIPLAQYENITQTNPIIQINSLEDIKQYSIDRIVFLSDLQNIESYQNLKVFYYFINHLLYVIYLISVTIFTFLWTYKNKEQWLHKYIDGFSQRYLLIEFCIQNIIFMIGQILLCDIFFDDMNFWFILKYIGIFYVIFIIVYAISLLKLTLKNTLRV